MPKKEKSYLVFEEAGTSPSGKTLRVRVKNTAKETLGGIEWLYGWRRYVFLTGYGGVAFDMDCLQEIADKLNCMMADHRAKGIE